MEYFNSLSTNAKIILGIAVVLVVGYIVYAFVWVPSTTKRVTFDTVPTNNLPAAEERVPIHVPIDMPMPSPTAGTATPIMSNKEIVLFSAPWCGHCKTLKPVWDEFAANFDGFNGIRIYAIDADANKELTKLHGVSGFPSIRYCPNGVSDPNSVPYEGDRSGESLVQFLNQVAAA